MDLGFVEVDFFDGGFVFDGLFVLFGADDGVDSGAGDFFPFTGFGSFPGGEAAFGGLFWGEIGFGFDADVADDSFAEEAAGGAVFDGVVFDVLDDGETALADSTAIVVDEFVFVDWHR